MIKIAICDDEEKIRKEVSACITEYAERKNRPDMEIFSFDSARSVISALDEKSTFDIFVLDVYMGEEIGTQLARSIRKRGIENPIIFLTTSLSHAPESFETATLRYLIKPLDPVKLYEAMDAAVAQVEKAAARRIKLKTENGIQSIKANHIMCAEAHAHYQHITLADGSQLRVRMTVAELYEMLIKHDGFARVGNAYIVNLRNIKNVSVSEVRLYNDISIPIPRGKHTEIKKAFWDYQYEGWKD